jgi:DNA repair exonuclease SbcCD ATPase subunit
MRRLVKSTSSSRSRGERLLSQLEEVEKELSESEAENTGLQVSRDEIDADTGSLIAQKRELEEGLEREKGELVEIDKALSEVPSEMGIDEQMAESRAKYLANRQILERLGEEIPQLMEKLADQQLKKTNLKTAEERHADLSRELEHIRDIRWAFNNIGPYARQKVFSSVAERTRDLFSRIYSKGPISKIALTQDYDVQATTSTGVKLSSKQLSIGERVMAGLALRIALAQVWQAKPSDRKKSAAGSPGFLILDEPTEYLDESNVRTLARTIAGLKTLGQIVIVTHDAGLMEEIGKKSEINKIVLTRSRG